jgi:transposase
MEERRRDNNCQIYRTREVVTFKENNHIVSLPWPPQSPDLNPIKHLWDKSGESALTTKELFEFLVEKWNRIESEILANLVDSIPRRISAAIKAKGNPTCYYY